ncbi:MAG: hypothetical protein WKF34_02940 [Pyrinomonadaceae bacterium]
MLYELQKKRVGNPALDEITQNKPVNSNVATVATLNPPERTAEKIAKEFDVSPRTVRTAAKVHQAFEQSPVETQDQFKEGKITQKALVESAKPKSAPAVDSRHDEITELAESNGHKIQTAVRNFESLIEDAKAAFARHSAEFSDFAWDISIHNFKKVTTEAFHLKKYAICPACSGTKCDHCKFGYVTESSEAAILDIINHQEAVSA